MPSIRSSTNGANVSSTNGGGNCADCATPFANGVAQSAQLPPPFVLETLAPFVEDLMLGITDLDAIKQSGTTIIDSASIDKPRAFEIIAEHTHLGRGGSSIK